MRLGLAVCVALASGLLAACQPPLPATLEFVDQSPLQPRLGEITTLRFRAIDPRGQPQPGVRVSFELQSPVPGVEINPKAANTNVGDGIASTQVIANGGRVASVVVVARVEGKVALSPAVTFAGAASNSRQFTFQCGSASGDASGGVHAIGAYDETRHLIAGVKLKCIAHVADRNGDGIVGAQVSFLTEAGTIGPSATSVTDVVGNAEVLYKTSYPLPQDVDPGVFTWNPRKDATHTGEYIAPLWMHPFAWVEDPIANAGAEPTFQEPRRKDPIRGTVNNPRDNLVTLIAVTTGEEAFDDHNNNGRWDPGEPFVDLTEPFVDNNDNGTWDPGERYVDTDGSGSWDGKNGRYDASTLIWVQERILWTGWPHQEDIIQSPRNPTPVIRQLYPSDQDSQGRFVLDIGRFGAGVVTFIVSDPWFNHMAQNDDTDGCEAGAAGPVEVSTLYSGVAFTYPAYATQRYRIKDKREPSDPFITTYPPPGARYEVRASCSFTASQESGHKVNIVAPTVAGLVAP
jgi:hypothetical protein